jgi:hypothetical protein
MGERENARIAAIADLVFQRGGVAGAIRRLVAGWPGRFSTVQISIALQRRWPLLVPNEYQVADCIEWMEKQHLIKCVIYKHSKIYEKTKHVQFSSSVRADGAKRREDIHHPHLRQNIAAGEGRSVEPFHRNAVQQMPMFETARLPGLSADPDHPERHHRWRQEAFIIRTGTPG